MSSVGTLGLNQVASIVICGPVRAYFSVCLDSVVLTLFLTLQYKFVVSVLCFTQYHVSLRIVLHFLALFPVNSALCPFRILSIAFVFLCIVFNILTLDYVIFFFFLISCVWCLIPCPCFPCTYLISCCVTLLVWFVSVLCFVTYSCHCTHHD